MATRGQMKSVEFKQAGVARVARVAGVARMPSAENAVARAARPASAAAVLGPGQVESAVLVGGTASTALAPSGAGARMESGAAAPLAPRFTAEEIILLRGLASGSTGKEMAGQMRLPRESLYRLMGDLRRKTGASTDTALAVWVLRNMAPGGGDRRGGGR
jgi:DNA-binding CsgD family transcriptional regulator